MEEMMSLDVCDGDYLGAYRRFLEHFVANVCDHEDQLPVKMGRRDVRECELTGEIADISLQHLNQRLPSFLPYLRLRLSPCLLLPRSLSLSS
ncbi:hypothetical protein TKK_0013343 [Trichogramma kaykai]|uniref:MCM N-terminal domain-containing protein n=1 Tax=Trichogramma kaykai TaxID=54128 RepID=A0ABD2WKF1_9HYME